MVRSIFVSALAFVSLGLLGCCAQTPPITPQGPRDGAAEAGERGDVLTPECAEEVPKVMGGMVLSDSWRAEACKRRHRRPKALPATATTDLTAWKQNPRLDPSLNNFGGHIQPSKASGKPGGHQYVRVPGLPACARIFCPFRPDCYEDLVARHEVTGEKFNDETCMDLQACEYVPDDPPESMDECFEPIPETAGPTEEF